MENEGEKHGLFGNIYNPDTLKIDCKVKDVMELVRQRSIEKKNVFRAVISFSPENTAVKLVSLLQKKRGRSLLNRILLLLLKRTI